MSGATSHPPADRAPPRTDIGIEDTGERFVPESGGHELMYAEHTARYRYACRWTRGRRVLDVACGVGFGTQMMAADDLATRVVGIDLSETAVRFAGIHHGAVNARYLRANALQLPFAEASFDVVVAFEFIEHIAEQAEGLAAARRVLTPGGRLIVSTPNRIQSAGPNPFHVRELTEAEFRSLLSAEFRFVEVLYQANVLASYLTPCVSYPGPHDVNNGFNTVIGDPVRPPEALFMVAVCSNEPLPPDTLRFEGGACLTRNTEYLHIRNMLEQRAQAIGMQTRTILDHDRLIHELHERLHKAHRVRRRDRDLMRGMMAELAAMGRRADRLAGSVEELAAALSQRDAELERLRGEFAAGVHAIDQRTREMQAVLQDGMAGVHDARRIQQARTVSDLQSISGALNSLNDRMG